MHGDFVSNEQGLHHAAPEARHEVDDADSHEFELLLEPEPNEHEVEHVGEQADDTGVEPDAGHESPPLVLVHHLVPHERAQLLQCGERGPAPVA